MAARPKRMHASVRSRTRFRALRYLTTLVVPALGWATFTGILEWTWSVPVFSFVLVPLLELVLHGRHNTVSEQEERALLADPVFDAILYVIVPVQYFLLHLFVHRMQAGGQAAGELLGNIVTMGILCGVYGINVAHELGHRTKRWERDLARSLLLTSLYMHFIIEHNRGHHRRVATPEDPASARYGETVYAFWPRSIVMSWRSAWRIEAERMRRMGERPFGPRNEMLHAMAWQFGLVTLIAITSGPNALVAFVAAALIGILLLETVNYIEHYGLQRIRLSSGGYGRVRHIHSWNSDHLLGRILLFELTRHSDHHWRSSKKYQTLASHADAPQLPTGYPGMMLLSLLPPLFFAVVHPRLKRLVEEHPDLALAG